MNDDKNDLFGGIEYFRSPEAQKAMIAPIINQIGAVVSALPKEQIEQAAFAEKFGVAKSNAARLLMTESAYMSSVAELQSYKDASVEFYAVLATLDLRTSNICQSYGRKGVSGVGVFAGAECSAVSPVVSDYDRSAFR
jgi:hypothetical protein